MLEIEREYYRALLPELEGRVTEARREFHQTKGEFKEAERKLRARTEALDYASRQNAEAFSRSQQIPRELGALKNAGPS